MNLNLSRADTRAEYRRILGRLEFHSGAALLKVSLCLGAAYLIAFLPTYPDLTEAGRYTLGIVLLCGLLWMTEAIPAFAVALLAIGLQILILGSPGGVLTDADDLDGWEKFVEPWASPSMWLFFGGFILAKASSRTGLDRDLAERLLKLAGTRPDRILLVAMVTTFTFSMFLSNTATAAMMLAILGPMLAKNTSASAGRALIVGVAFSANIGGMGTIIGTPPNAIASGLLASVYPINFLTWMAFGLPPAILLLAGLWLSLRKKVEGSKFHLDPRPEPDRSPEEIPEGPIVAVNVDPDHVPNWQRLVVLFVFAFTVALWLTGTWHGIPTAVISFFPIVLFCISGVIRAQD
ncbi:MAG: SLC13 family permease, partial [Verrucomicrobiota bacterium]